MEPGPGRREVTRMLRRLLASWVRTRLRTAFYCVRYRVRTDGDTGRSEPLSSVEVPFL